MAMRAEYQNQHAEQYPQKKKRRRRKNSQCLINVTAVLVAAGLLIAAGALCWKGIQLVWNGIEASLAFISPDAPLISVLDTAPSESISGDCTAPVLSGVHDVTVYQGDTISYMSGIAATDETDSNPTITVDNQSVDLSRPGEYQVIYTATDGSGNTTKEKATVTVMERPENFVELDTIYAAADAKLDEIIRENATIKQQVHDIYAWARLNLSYGGHSDRTDWRQTAYGMLTDGKGDCYGFWAVTKLLFERLEIPNIDVQKVKNAADDTDHFWSLLSMDGGETWFHFDATPRHGDGDDFCLVTDAFIDAYSDSHEGSHNRDRSVYPKTP